ncbi:hypothetical protein K458DRAFT_411533 [Lentithecium fluviatile CBS 122367]|uniref:Altered inheritance of mitochondria protein 11 n=1 Tax=Lentithecium fluviatile CBS 122367 TaxID=1168545 RepID=A0A6G1JMN6_9PLEO|nr:hypothetical protein K458DRAFT_411533 [Lentithecium fluviatile CBS 122367]
MEALQKLPIIRMMSRSPASPVNPPPRPPPETAYESTPVTSPRSLRQLSILALGATCFLASTAITRRAVYRRHLRVKPKFWEPNTNPHEHFSPFHDAIQALNLASMNIFSLAITGVGGTMWAFDISGLKEAQVALRGRLNYETIYRGGEAVPESLGDLLKASREIAEKEEDENGKPETPR